MNFISLKTGSARYQYSYSSEVGTCPGEGPAAHLAQDDVVGTHHQQVALKLLDDFLLHPVVHVH